MFQLYDFQGSGNGYKARLLLTQTDRPFRYHECNILKGESRTPEFLKMNPNGKIPLLITPEGKPLSESGAILCFLAEGTPFMPADAWERALVMQWLFWEQYNHEPYIATSRFWMHYGDPEACRSKLEERRPGGLAALAMMENHLKTRDFFVGERYTIADIALYAYTHVSDEGGFPLDDYPAIRAWIERVRTQPKHIQLLEKVGV